jgi:hypothetical protein
MNQKLAREIRFNLRNDIKYFSANTENRSDGSFHPVEYSYDFKKKSYVKTGKGVPFRYSADSPRRIYRDRKQAYKKDISDGIPFEEAICFLIEPQISQYENLPE